jgi:chemotaxis protein MotB
MLAAWESASLGEAERPLTWASASLGEAERPLSGSARATEAAHNRAANTPSGRAFEIAGFRDRLVEMKVLVWIVALLTLAVTAAAGYLLKVKYDAFTHEIAQCRSQQARVRADLDKERRKIAELSSVGDQHKSQLTELAELRQRSAETEKRVEAFKSLRARLQKMIDTGKLKVSVRKGRMLLKLPAEVLFPSGEAELSDDGKEALKEVAAVLKEFPDRKFMVSGHTDNAPVVRAGFKNNWELSAARAVNVVMFMVESGVRANNLVAAGYSEYDPVAGNGSKAGRQDNRRIEIELLPNLSELPKLLDETEKQAATTEVSAPAKSAPATAPAK